MKLVKNIFLIILIGSLTVVAALSFYVRKEMKRPNELTDYQIFEIKNGESLQNIASRLKARDIIKSDLIFMAGVTLERKTLSFGYYQLPPRASIIDVIKLIAGGKSIVYKVTIPEGWRAEQIAQLLSERKIVGYSDFLLSAQDLEGKLFPDTYYFAPGSDASKIVQMMNNDYAERTKNLSVSDTDLIIASIVEREAVKDEERPLIAGIYKNRIARKMKLEADPTVQFGKDSNEIIGLSSSKIVSSFKFWRPITLADYQTVDSDYNTYLISSLPPGPICNPGLKSIEATINYQKHDYLYFLQNGGAIYPAKSVTEHNKNRVNILGAKL